MQFLMLLLFEHGQMLLAWNSDRSNKMELAGLIRVYGIGATKKPAQSGGNARRTHWKKRICQHFAHLKKLVLDASWKQYFLLKGNGRGAGDTLEHLYNLIIRIKRSCAAKGLVLICKLLRVTKRCKLDLVAFLVVCKQQVIRCRTPENRTFCAHGVRLTS